jgi:hypothetical protein
MDVAARDGRGLRLGEASLFDDRSDLLRLRLGWKSAGAVAELPFAPGF